MRVYTKTGDHGETGLLGGGRIAKDSLKMALIGEVDELNAALGLCRACLESGHLATMLGSIQRQLFDLGAEIATPQGSPISLQTIGTGSADELEASMDEQSESLDELRNFILPGGSEAGARLHYARAVCRRVERSAWALKRQEQLRPELLVFLNRLSDWLFVAARTANACAGVEDATWTR